jgi:uncharacterized membrane protein YphA (DoxX/SURF4 family)
MNTLRSRIAHAARWLFASRLASPLWLGVRIYLGSVWLQFGLAKIRGGWLTGNPLHGLLDAVARGHTPAPFPAYRHLAQALVDTGADRILSFAIPLTELVVAAAFFSGLLLVPAAVGAVLLNLNLILSGIASWEFDGRIIILQLLLLVAWRVAGYLGLGQVVAAKAPRRVRRRSLLLGYQAA